MKPPVSLTNIQLLKLTWRITGGWRALLKSKDFWLSFIIAAICTRLWLYDSWFDTVIAIVPSMLGFTLSGFAIFLSFGSDDFKALISSEDELKSPYLSTSAAFMAFVAFQVISLMYALCAKALAFKTPCVLYFAKPVFYWLTPVFDFLGFLVFCYSILLSLRAALRIFRLSRWLNYYLLITAQKQKDQNNLP